MKSTIKNDQIKKSVGNFNIFTVTNKSGFKMKKKTKRLSRNPVTSRLKRIQKLK